jgi:hypothetical protein
MVRGLKVSVKISFFMAATFICATTTSSLGQDYISVDEFLNEYDTSSPSSQDVFHVGIRYLEEGFSWSNVYLTTTRQADPLYCPPPSLALTPEQLIDILRHSVNDNPTFGTEPLGLILLLSLQHTFPCNELSK